MRSQKATTRRATAGPCPTLVLGLGNILLRDEGVGVRVIEAMADVELPPDVELFDGATAGMDLLDALANRTKVIVIDAIDSECEAGTVLRLTPDELANPVAADVSLHDIGLMEVLAATRQMGIAPNEVVVLGVKPKEVSHSLDLSPEIRDLVPRIVDLVLEELNT